VIFNPSFPYRLTHMVIASLLTAAFLVMGISAWRMRDRVDGPATRQVFRTGLVMAVVLAPLQVFVGDLHGLNTLEHQPAKIAAIEALWETDTHVPFTLFGFPDEDSRSTRFALEIPYAASLVLTHRLDGGIPGVNEFEGEHPPVAAVFWSFRVMVGMGLLMLISAWWAGWKLLVRSQEISPLMLRVFSWMTFSGWVAVLAGWYVTEIGRQPWVVYGMMRVSEALTPSLSGAMALTTLVGYIVVYSVVFGAGVYYLRHVLVQGLEPIEGSGDSDSARPKRPFSAVSTNFDGETQTGRS
jgi:cytochrome d ubiquinol oxidase subunit I